MRTKSIPVYTYDELSDSAKEQVRTWWSQDIDYDFVYEDAATIADQEAQRPFLYKLYATMKHRGNYQHSGCMQVEVEIDSDNDYSDSATWRNSEDTVIQCMRDFADWIYKQLEAEYEYQSSDEAVAEACEANGYEFYEDGSIV